MELKKLNDGVPFLSRLELANPPTTMSDYHNFAIWGAGNLGTDVVAELLALRPAGCVASVTALSVGDMHVYHVATATS
jgi:hypothetical protein